MIVSCPRSHLLPRSSSMRPTMMMIAACSFKNSIFQTHIYISCFFVFYSAHCPIRNYSHACYTVLVLYFSIVVWCSAKCLSSYTQYNPAPFGPWTFTVQYVRSLQGTRMSLSYSKLHVQLVSCCTVQHAQSRIQQCVIHFWMSKRNLRIF